MKNNWLILLFLILVSCTSSSRRWDTPLGARSEKLYVVNLDDAPKEDFILLSSFFKDVETIILETNDECLIGEVNSIRVLDNFIVVMDSKISEAVFVFDKEGRFLHKIGKIGQGPGEYQGITDSSIDFEKNEIYLNDSYADKILKYDIASGKFISSMNIGNDVFDNYFMHYANGKIYTSSIPYRQNGDSFLLQEYDANTGKTMASYLKASAYNKGWNDFYSRSDGFFYPNEDGSAKYTQMFMDTVISISNNEIIPYLAVKVKNWITEKDIQELIKSDKENNVTLSHEILFQRNISYDINHYFELGDIIHFQYSNSGNMESVIYDIVNNSARRADYLKDDFIYSGDWVLFHSFIYADNDGAYSYLRTDQVPKFLELAQTGGINENLDKLDILRKLPEDTNPVIFYHIK